MTREFEYLLRKWASMPTKHRRAVMDALKEAFDEEDWFETAPDAAADVAAELLEEAARAGDHLAEKNAQEIAQAARAVRSSGAAQ